jgi:hypothetical protein
MNASVVHRDHLAVRAEPHVAVLAEHDVGIARIHQARNAIRDGLAEIRIEDRVVMGNERGGISDVDLNVPSNVADGCPAASSLASVRCLLSESSLPFNTMSDVETG